MPLPHVAARVVLAYATLAEGAAALARRRERGAAFEAALERALLLGRRLVVIGDPSGGPHTRLLRASVGGEGCIDKDRGSACPVTIVSDLTCGSIDGVDDDSAVVFVSCALEYVDDLGPALLEIARIAGTADNVFIVTVQPWTLAARLYPGARWRGTVTNRGSEQAVEMTAVRLGEKVALAGALGFALAAAFLPRSRR